MVAGWYSSITRGAICNSSAITFDLKTRLFEFTTATCNSFEEARSVFFDENGILIHDPDHSEQEDRYLMLGMSAKARLLVVSHTYRNNDHAIRLISAWLATPQEHNQYGDMK